MAAAPEITQEMIAECAYHISQSGEGGTDEENWHRAECKAAAGLVAPALRGRRGDAIDERTKASYP